MFFLRCRLGRGQWQVERFKMLHFACASCSEAVVKEARDTEEKSLFVRKKVGGRWLAGVICSLSWISNPWDPVRCGSVDEGLTTSGNRCVATQRWRKVLLVIFLECEVRLPVTSIYKWKLRGGREWKNGVRIYAQSFPTLRAFLLPPFSLLAHTRIQEVLYQRRTFPCSFHTTK